MTVDGPRYRRMLSYYFFNEIRDIDVRNIWFQQDGATFHTAHRTIELLREKFPGRLLSKGGDQNWPPRSCDLTPLDFFLFGYLKSRVYANNPQTLQQLKDNIRRAIAEISPDMCRKVIENFQKRIQWCKKARGGHMADIIFHL